MYAWHEYTVFDTDDGDSVFDYIDDVLSSEPSSIQIGSREYWYMPAGYDIETTRLDKHAYMYHWQWSLGNKIFLGRSWRQYEQLIEALNKYLKRYKLRLITWVANLGHEFAFLQYRHKWSSVFARAATKPLKAATGKIEFRECLSISGQGGLANLAKNYCKTQKAKNDLDYSKLRNNYSKLKTTEKGYCIADVAILTEWGQYMFDTFIKEPGDKLPMTQTGICRKAVDDAARATGAYNRIKTAVKALYPRKKEQYDYLMYYLFRGGFTHANAYYASNDDVSQVVENVIGYDYTSSYPAVMLHEMCKYPIARFVPAEIETDGVYITDSRLDLDKHAIIMTVTFRGLRPRTLHSIESDHKIITKDYPPEGIVLDNGRVIRAESMTVCITELDYFIYTWFYTWDSIEIINAQIAPKGSLPKYLTEPLLAAYKAKVQLKAQKLDHTPEYMNAKAVVNSFYGMTVQRLVFTQWIFDPEDTKKQWKPQVNRQPYWKQISDKLLSPYWGIWVTAWARYKLLSVVAKLDPDREHFNVVYCDTDSIYLIDTPRNRQIIRKHNAEMMQYNDPLPQECKGKKNGKGALGCFDPIDDGVHYKFKTLGAKRYIKLANGVAEITVAGMRKGSYEHAFASEEPPENDDYIIVRIPDPEDRNKKKEMYISEYDLFAHFRDGLILDVDVADKLYTKYAPYAYAAEINGVVMQELSGVALIPEPFTIKMSHYYKSLISQLQADRRQFDFDFAEADDIEYAPDGSLYFVGDDTYI